MTSEDDNELPPRRGTNRPSAAQDARSVPEQMTAIVETLRQAFQPCCIERSDAEELARIAVPYHFDSGAHLLRRESRSDALWLIELGHVAVGRTDQQGNWRQSRSVRAGQWLDIESAWLGGGWLESARSTTQVIAHEFPLPDLQLLVGRRPDLNGLFIAALAARIRHTTDAAHDQLVRDVPARLASWLLEQLSQHAAGKGRLMLREQKRVLASELGTSPETLSRALSRLRGLGFVAVRGYMVEVLDLGGLQRFAGRAPTAPLAGRSES